TQADGSRDMGSLSGTASGVVRLGANTLTVGGGGTSTTYSGSIQGTGGLTKTRSGTLKLAGNNSHNGTSNDGAGTLNARGGSGSDTIGDNAALVFLNNRTSPAGTDYTLADTDVYSGTVGGTGALVKDGSGVLWLRGPMSYTGGTMVANGVLIGNTRSL